MSPRSASAGPVARRAAKLRGELKNLVRFQIGETCYAFDVATVDEVVHPGRVTPLALSGGIRGRGATAITETNV